MMERPQQDSKKSAQPVLPRPQPVLVRLPSERGALPVALRPAADFGLV